MNAFVKAISLIEGTAAREGGYPEAVDLVRYSAADFERAHPGESFIDHQRHMTALRAWCADRGIAVTERRTRGATPMERARSAARPPYRLGVSFAYPFARDLAGRIKSRWGALGWSVIWLGRHEGGEL